MGGQFWYPARSSEGRSGDDVPRVRGTTQAAVEQVRRHTSLRNRNREMMQNKLSLPRSLRVVVAMAVAITGTTGLSPSISAQQGRTEANSAIGIQPVRKNVFMLIGDG